MEYSIGYFLPKKIDIGSVKRAEFIKGKGIIIGLDYENPLTETIISNFLDLYMGTKKMI